MTDIQPVLGGAGAGETPEETVSQLAAKLESEIPAVMDRSSAGEDVFAPNEKGELNSLQIVLLHEMGRFNKLLRTVIT